MCVTLDASFFRNSRSQMFYKVIVLKNFAKVTEKLLCRSFCFNKVAGLQAGTLLRKRFRQRCFPMNFVKYLRTPILLLLKKKKKSNNPKRYKKVLHKKKCLFRYKKLCVIIYIYILSFLDYVPWTLFFQN